jgi:hypothetical protein
MKFKQPLSNGIEKRRGVRQMNLLKIGIIQILKAQNGKKKIVLAPKVGAFLHVTKCNAGHRDGNSIWITQNGVNGRLFGSVPNQIFLPATGFRPTNSGAYRINTNGEYWSNAQINDYNDRPACYLSFTDHFVLIIYPAPVYNEAGRSIRCVAE